MRFIRRYPLVGTLLATTDSTDRVTFLVPLDLWRNTNLVDRFGRDLAAGDTLNPLRAQRLFEMGIASNGLRCDDCAIGQCRHGSFVLSLCRHRIDRNTVLPAAQNVKN